jgi:hypothetical protein
MVDKSTLQDGFTIGNYFVSFPPGDFVQEDADGNLFVLVDIYQIQGDNSVIKVNNKDVPPELEEQINEQINKFLMDMLDREESGEVNVED